MRGDVIYREPLFPEWLLVPMMGVIGATVELAAAGSPSWKRLVALVAATILLGRIPRPGVARVEVGAATIRVRDASGVEEAAIFDLTAIEWADQGSVGFRKGDGDLFLITRGELPEHRWDALLAQLRGHLPLVWPTEENPFARSAA